MGNGRFRRCCYAPHHVYSQCVDSIGARYRHVYIAVRHGIHELGMAWREVHQDSGYMLWYVVSPIRSSISLIRSDLYRWSDDRYGPLPSSRTRYVTW